VHPPPASLRAAALQARAREAVALARRVDRPLAVGLVVAAATAALFAQLADSLREDEALSRLDRSVANWMVDHRGDGLVTFLRQVTRLANPATVVVVVAGVALALAIRRHVASAALLVASSAGAAVLVGVAKLVVARPRPPVSGAAVTAHGYSFPSGHAAQSVACYGALAIVAFDVVRGRRLRIVLAVAAAAAAFLIGASRIVLGVHWCTDVLAGWALALGWLAFVSTAARLRGLRASGAGVLRGPPEPGGSLPP
jgi:undecaprenyl-diphosphatase